MAAGEDSGGRSARPFIDEPELPTDPRPKSVNPDARRPDARRPDARPLDARRPDARPLDARPLDARPDTRRTAPDPRVGDSVGPYRLLALLGKGGAGSVFKARHQRTDRVVALKVLAAAKTKRARIVQRFFDEVRAASSVDHPGLVKVYDFIEEEEPRRLAYAMEFVDGEPLRVRLRREGALALRTAIAVGAQISDALTALHEAGIIHRDLKPENILLVDDGALRVKLLDFGVVKFLPVDRTVTDPAAEPTTAGTFVGTPRYMAPEQAAGAQVDHRADLFALGVMLFEMITGACPHEGDSLRDVVLAKLKGAPRITVNPEQEILPEELTDIVDACLQLKPSLRPDSAAEVSAVLAHVELVLFAVGRPVRVAESPSVDDTYPLGFDPGLGLESAWSAPMSPELPTAVDVQPRGLVTDELLVDPGLPTVPFEVVPVRSRPWAQPVPMAVAEPQGGVLLPDPAEPGPGGETFDSRPTSGPLTGAQPILPPWSVRRYVAIGVLILVLAVSLAMIARILTQEDTVLVLPDPDPPAAPRP